VKRGESAMWRFFPRWDEGAGGWFGKFCQGSPHRIGRKRQAKGHTFLFLILLSPWRRVSISRRTDKNGPLILALSHATGVGGVRNRAVRHFSLSVSFLHAISGVVDSCRLHTSYKDKTFGHGNQGWLKHTEAPI